MSDIEWTDETWGVAVGCKMVSEGCRHCYAQAFAHRGMAPQHRGLTVMTSHGPRWNGEVRFVPEALTKPLSWRKPRKVFVASMSDMFHEGLTNEQIAAVFGVMAACPQHTFQVLTKRPERMRAWFEWLRAQATLVVQSIGCDVTERRIAKFMKCRIADHVEDATGRTGLFDGDEEVGPQFPWPLPNVWLGVSAENQATADERVPLLLQTPAAVRFVSAEPLLGPIDLAGNGGGNDWLGDHYDADEPGGIDWVIVGGESGPGARACDVAWIRSIVEQCREAGVACFVKQFGSRPHAELSRDGKWIESAVAEWPEGTRFCQRVPGHSTHGMVLADRKGGDPAEWPEDMRVRQFPEVRRA